MRLSRRMLLQRTFAGGTLLVFGCDAGSSAPGPGTLHFAGGEYLGDVPFVNEGGTQFHVPLGAGWDGRLYTDLSMLEPDSPVVPNDLFYVRTRYPDLLDESKPWTIQVGGLVGEEVVLTLDDLTPHVEDQGVHLLECSGNSDGGRFGLMSACVWGGVPFAKVLSWLKPLPEATRVLLEGFDGHSVPSANEHSKPGASWVFTVQQLLDAGAFLAMTMNGEPLPKDHGFPVRLFVPGWYGCTCIKWLEALTFVGEDEPATAQMKEFAWRTHQMGVPDLAKDYLPATLDHTAMPVRVEKWRVEGEIVYRIVGILWGGREPTDALAIEIGDLPQEPVSVCPPVTTTATWTLWEHAFKPPAPGVYTIGMRITDPAIPTRRLDMGWYLRDVDVDEV